MLPRKPARAVLAVLFTLLAALLFEPLCLAQARPADPQEVLDAATAEPLLDFNVKWAGFRSERVNRSKAMNLLALEAFHDPKAKATDGTVCAARVLAHIRNILQPGNEPDCSGGLAGRTHVSVAQTFLLAQRTPAVWNALTDAEKTKIDWLMRAFAIAANWGFDDDNDFKTTLDFEGNYVKTWNPNFVEPYMGVLIACVLYFGGENKLNALFTGFDYDTYMRQFDPEHLNFPNVTKVWGKAGKQRMENGCADDGFGGSGKGVKTPFTYQGAAAGDINKIYEIMARRQYAKKVTDGLTKWGATAKLVSGSSPYLGQTGMMFEFDTADGQGMRSDADYCYHSLLAGAPTRAMMQALGVWKSNPEVEGLMKVGVGDLIYKLQQGYQSHSKGKDHVDTEAEVGKNGYWYVKEIWRMVLVEREPRA